MNRPCRSSAVASAAARWSVVLVGAALVATGCGTAELDVDPTFDGSWDVVELAQSGAAIDLSDQTLEIEIDTGQAAVRGLTNCLRFFGSYTLVDADASDEGDASFTIPSPTASDDCAAADRLVHTELVEALESVTRWRREGSILTLSAPTGTQLELQLRAQSQDG